MVTPNTFSIGAAAHATGLSVKAIRYYEEIGLIPRVRRTNGHMHAQGQRLYTAPQVGRLRFIRRARLLGLALADIRQLLAAAGRSGCPSLHPEYQQILETHLSQIDQRIQQLQALRAEIAGVTSSRQPADVAGITLESCACLQPAERTSPSALPSQQRSACACGCCNTALAASRRAPTGKPLDVRIVSARHPSQGDERRKPARTPLATQGPGRTKA